MLSVPTQTSTMSGTLSGFGVLGQSMPGLAQALSTGILSALRVTALQTVDTGTIGVGVGFIPAIAAAPLLVNPGLLTSLLVTNFKFNGIAGTHGNVISGGIATGFISHLATATVTSQHPGVGSGVGVGFLVPSLSTYTSLIATAIAPTFNGSLAGSLGQAVAQSVVAFLAGIVFTIPIVGPAGPIPSAGAGLGFLV